MLGDVKLGAAAEFDHADALAAIDHLAGLDGADDAAGDEADDLFDDGDGPAVGGVADNDGVRLILLRGRVVTHRVDEFALLIVHGQHFSVAGRAVDVDIQYRKKK